jgi:CxxC motif-containing protein (DUF1111 family)
MCRIRTGSFIARGAVFAGALILTSTLAAQQPVADPGPRAGDAGAGARIAALTTKESKFFDSGRDAFEEVATPTGTSGTELGLGPRFNLNNCAGCHAHPAAGGSSPASNPQVVGGVAPQSQIDRVVGLGIVSANGPVREVRFTSDGGVHDLFTIAGMDGVPDACNISQPAFASNTLRFRIPTPLFGAGLIEAIEDATIAANVHGGKPFGIAGSANRNGNDGTITRFGWKAQNKSLVIFSGEAYNVEQGITNALFPDERGESGVQDPEACRWLVAAPQDTINYEFSSPQSVIDDASNFSDFMRFLAAPVPVTTSFTTTLGVTVPAADITAGKTAFNKAGCQHCHIESMTTGKHETAALRYKTATLFSDLLLHDIGTGDDISQGLATGAQFRTAPLWGVGQRLFFMHDGEETDLLSAINRHGGPEGARVRDNFNGIGPQATFNLTDRERQQLLNFLRSL